MIDLQTFLACLPGIKPLVSRMIRKGTGDCLTDQGRNSEDLLSLAKIRTIAEWVSFLRCRRRVYSSGQIRRIRAIMIKAIHPFPARMAPELALAGLDGLSEGSVVLDPMTGSGTVCRQASDLGHRGFAFDMDPLAVLMTRAWTTPYDDAVLARVADEVVGDFGRIDGDAVELEWIDKDPETDAFARFWFGDAQRNELRKLAFLIDRRASAAVSADEIAAVDILRVAMSRIVITKENGASLARDVSHSRPHKVTDQTDYDVLKGFEKSIRFLRGRLADAPPKGQVTVRRGDARNMSILADGSIDAVLTSPPYLNAIDYLRGHRLALIWLGHRISELRKIRSDSIGSERRPDLANDSEDMARITLSMGDTSPLPARFRNMIDRYVQDLHKLMSELDRVMKPNCQATFVVGNSCLRGVFIDNAAAVAKAAECVGFTIAAKTERELPEASRYLPLTSDKLGKRMRSEVILTLRSAA